MKNLTNSEEVHFLLIFNRILLLANVEYITFTFLDNTSHWNYKKLQIVDLHVIFYKILKFNNLFIYYLLTLIYNFYILNLTKNIFLEKTFSSLHLHNLVIHTSHHLLLPLLLLHVWITKSQLSHRHNLRLPTLWLRKLRIALQLWHVNLNMNCNIWVTFAAATVIHISHCNESIIAFD